MTKAKIKKVISGAVAVAAAAAIIGGSIAAVNARKPISVAERPAAVKTSDQPFVTEVTGESKKFQDSRNDHSGKRKNCGIGRCEI